MTAWWRWKGWKQYFAIYSGTPFWAAAPKGAMSYRTGGICPYVCPSVRPYVRPSVNIHEKSPKSGQNSLKPLRLCTEPLRTHLFARPGLFLYFLFCRIVGIPCPNPKRITEVISPVRNVLLTCTGEFPRNWRTWAWSTKPTWSKVKKLNLPASHSQIRN